MKISLRKKRFLRKTNLFKQTGILSVSLSAVKERTDPYRDAKAAAGKARTANSTITVIARTTSVTVRTDRARIVSRTMRATGTITEIHTPAIIRTMASVRKTNPLPRRQKLRPPSNPKLRSDRKTIGLLILNVP